MAGKTTSGAADRNALISPRLDIFYNTVFLPPHLRNMLYLHGIYEIEDLVWFDEPAIALIQEKLLAGTLGGALADFSSKADQKKFLGGHMKPEQFEFRYVDLQKLKRLSVAAREYLEDEKQKRKQGDARQCSRKRQRDRCIGYTSSDGQYSNDSYGYNSALESSASNR